MSKEKNEAGAMLCPVGRFFSDLEKRADKDSEFHKHLGRSRLEFLKAVRALVDDRIAHFEKREAKKGKKRVTKIKVD
jgi:hypothetical protein